MDATTEQQRSQSYMNPYLAGIGLGLVLIAIVIVVNALAWAARRGAERYAG